MESDNKLILRLALPAVMQTVVRSLFVIVDAFWVGKIGSKELAAITVATFLVWGILALGEIISTGTNSLIAQTCGAKDFELSKKISSVNIVNTFFHSIFIGLAFIPLLPFFYSIMNLDAEQSRLASEYLITLLFGLPCIILLSTISSIFRGYGNTKTPFYLLVSAIILNIFLAPLFIFGINGFLQLGIKGAALSTVVSFLLASFIGYYLLRKGNLTGKLTDYKYDFKIIKETYRIGFPVALNGLAFSMIYVFVARFVADYGYTGFAALGIGHRSESMAYQITVGFSLAATILVGQNVGAGNKVRAEKLAWKILGLSEIVMIVYGLLLFIFSKEISQFFTKDESVIIAASLYNRIAAAVLIFSAAEVVLTGAFSGAGDTVPTAIVGLPLNFLRIPLAAILSPLMGLYGIWIAICSTVILKGIIITLWFKKGNWKKKEIKIIEPIPKPEIFFESEL